MPIINEEEMDDIREHMEIASDMAKMLKDIKLEIIHNKKQTLFEKIIPEALKIKIEKIGEIISLKKCKMKSYNEEQKNKKTIEWEFKKVGKKSQKGIEMNDFEITLNELRVCDNEVVKGKFLDRPTLKFDLLDQYVIKAYNNAIITEKIVNSIYNEKKLYSSIIMFKDRTYKNEEKASNLILDKLSYVLENSYDVNRNIICHIIDKMMGLEKVEIINILNCCRENKDYQVEIVNIFDESKNNENMKALAECITTYGIYPNVNEYCKGKFNVLYKIFGGDINYAVNLMRTGKVKLYEVMENARKDERALKHTNFHTLEWYMKFGKLPEESVDIIPTDVIKELSPKDYKLVKSMIARDIQNEEITLAKALYTLGVGKITSMIRYLPNTVSKYRFTELSQRDIKRIRAFEKAYKLDGELYKLNIENPEKYIGTREFDLLKADLNRMKVNKVIGSHNISDIFRNLNWVKNNDFAEFFIENLDSITEDSIKSLYINKIMPEIQKKWLDLKEKYAIVDLEVATGEIFDSWYGKEDIGNQFIAAMKKAIMSPEEVEKCMAIYEKMINRKASTIPKIEGEVTNTDNSEDEKYTYRMLDLNDPMNLVVGNLTDCCFTVLGASKNALKYACESTNSRIFVIENKGNIIAQSWVWRDGNGVCFDNIEIQKRARYKVDSLDINKVYKAAAEAIMGVCDDIEIVTVGTRYNKIDVLGQPCSDILIPPKDIYTDAKMQVVIGTSKNFEGIYHNPNVEPIFEDEILTNEKQVSGNLEL